MKFYPPLKNKTNLKYLAISLLISVILYSGSPLFPKRGEFVGRSISDIVLVGNKNTTSDDIFAKIEMRKGAILSEKMINGDLKALFSTGFFFNIDIKAENGPNNSVKIIYELKERPRVEEIDFIGADEVFPADLRDKMPLKEGEVISPDKVTAARDMILKKYRDEGFFHAYVKFEIGKVNPKSNLVKVKFIIDEGDEIPVSKINIMGTKNVEPSEIQAILELKETGFIESGNFKETSFETDKQKIVAYLKTKGYLDAELVPEGTGWEIHWENPKKKDKRVIVVNFKLNEGDLYYFNGYTTNHDYTLDPSGVPVFLNKETNPIGTPKEKLKPVFETKYLENLYEFTTGDVGEVFDEGKFVKDRGLINELYSGKGYLFAQVVPKRRYITLNETELANYGNCSKKSDEEKKSCEEEYRTLHIDELKSILKDNPDYKGRKFVHVDFVIRENNLAYVENIIIKGNKKTLDRVIRRELLFKTGDLFNSTLVNRSRERIFNLGYFKEVNFNMRPGSDETKMNLIVELVEQPTGTISMGGGYGTITGFSIFTELGENNLNGTG
ncbi:MAG: outer membrane protein assembly factor, partial [Leptospira sp.]|nr:outer membrane protein assembly factor [Leptospira sp.]